MSKSKLWLENVATSTLIKQFFYRFGMLNFYALNSNGMLPRVRYIALVCMRRDILRIIIIFV